MNKKTVKDIDVRGKRVLVRVDFNVPQDEAAGEITDDTRIRSVLPTINYLIGNGAKVILCSHLGRPKGKAVDKLRLTPVAERLSHLMGLKVEMATDCIGPEVEKAAARLGEGDILLLENLRFHPEEEQNDPGFAQALAQLADVHVNDAFGTAHRTHASTVGVASYLPAVAGFLMEKEIDIMGRALDEPVRPFTTIIGGAKVSDKLAIIENIIEKADSLLIGGGMASTFLKAEGYEVGRSLVEEDWLDSARKMLKKAKKNGVRLLLPIDVIVAETVDENALWKAVPVAEVPSQWHIVDIGPKTVALFEDELKRSKTVIWNGPMGVIEIPQFSEGTSAIIRFLSHLDATTIIGGGSTAEAVEKVGLVDKHTHVSTGGGASLKFLEGKTLPGVAVLLDKES
jgi:phosphoglycerate kinase